MTIKHENKLIQANIKDVQSGKGSAYEQLYRVHAGRIYTFGLKMYARNKSAAKELTKRVFIKGFEQINNFSDNITFILWLRKFAVEEIRKGEIKKSDEANKLSPADEALFSIPVEERMIFILSEIDKLSTQEITEITHYTSEEINEKLEKARKTLMEIFEVDNSDDLDQKINFITFKTEPEDDLWNDVYSQIHSIATKGMEEETTGEVLNVGDAKLSLSEKLEKLKEVKTKKQSLSSPKKRFYIIVVLLLITAAIWYFFALSEPEWDVINLSGSPSVQNRNGNVVVKNSTVFEYGATLRTNEYSRAVIKISGMTEIYLNPGSLLKRGGDEGEVIFYNGEINIVKEKESKPFSVEVYSVKVEDYKSGKFSVKTENEDAVIYSESAGLRISSDESKMYLVPGYQCRISREGKIKIPVSQTVSKEFINALDIFISERSNENLNGILLLSEKKDALTLINILPMIEKPVREIVVNKIHSMVNVPGDVNPNQVINLNEPDIIKWLNEIEKVNLVH